MKENPNVSDRPDPVPVCPSAESLAAPITLQAHWLKRFLACNPFYLLSAALLLYGFYRVSVDPNFLRREISQLFFNFTALQFYEILVVFTALVLVRKKIWYDSTLLVGLENLLVLVPFILISQAALIEIHWVWGTCLAASLTALVRSGALKRFFTELNFPTRLTRIGLIVLAVNALLPVTYRILHEHKVGKLPTTGSAYMTNEFAWLLLLPGVCALANIVPAKSCKGVLLPQREWIPPGLFSLWVLGTMVHLYCLGYVYDFALRLELVAPVIWVCLWTLVYRVQEFVPNLEPTWERAMLLLPLLATLIGISQPGNEVFLCLTILNVAIYGGVCVRRGDRFSRHLMLISIVALIAGFPEDWGRSLLAELTRGKCVAASAALYFLVCAVFSRNPKLGLAGALVSAFAVTSVIGSPRGLHWGIQSGLAFLLVHSLCWAHSQHEGTGAVRLLASIGWVAHTFWWMHDGGAAWMSSAVATPVFVSYLAARWVGGKWGSPLIPISAAIVLLSEPGDSAVGMLQSSASGLMAVIGSFLLFAAGTCAALTKHRWLH
jgi:hypothetical protein